MVVYARPKYISKTAVGTDDFRFSATSLDPQAPEPRTPTCTRCVVNIAKGKHDCDKPDGARCQCCVKGHRAGCILIPREWYGRYERLYLLRDRYRQTVTAAIATHGNVSGLIRRDPEVQRTGVRLARAQRTFTKSFQARRLIAGRGGEQFNAATHNPTTTADFLKLVLAEQRKQVANQAGIIKEARIMNETLARVADSFDAFSDIVANGITTMTAANIAAQPQVAPANVAAAAQVPLAAAVANNNNPAHNNMAGALTGTNAGNNQGAPLTPDNSGSVAGVAHVVAISSDEEDGDDNEVMEDEEEFGGFEE